MPSEKVVLRNSHREFPSGSTVLGASPADELMEISVILRRRAPLPASDSGKVVTREEFARLYGAGAADIDRVREFAESEGLRVVSSDAARRTMVLAGTSAQMQKAFAVDLVRVSHHGRTFRGRTGAVHVPVNLDGVIEAVHGLDNRPQARARFRLRDAARAVPHAQGDTSYTPVQVAQLYSFPNPANGAGQTIGIIELGGGYSDSDLATYFGGLGISPAPAVTSVGIGNASNQPTGDPSGPDGEVALDIEVAGAVAPGAAIAVYFAPNTDQGFIDAITTAIHDNANKPSVISISWGGPESSWTQQSLQSFDQAFQDAAILGVTVCVAAGDGGSSDGQTDGLQHVDFPASSPHALACGGTRLVSQAGAIQSEVVWNDGPGQGATGGGVSESFPLPSFQTSSGVPVSVNGSQFAGRGVPDVAGDADPATGYQVLVDGQNIVVGGTSAVAPLWAGLIALINQTLGKPAGYLNPAIYALPAASGAFRDITSGNNGSYSAGPGWDACTGLGSPDGAALLTALSSPAPSA